MYSVVINSDKCSYLPTRSYPNLVIFKKDEKKYNKVSLHTRNDNGQTINIKERALKIQDNTNATNTTTNNMVSNRKRSNSLARYNEEYNAKKAMLNPSESGYPQSDPASENIDDKELLELAQELAENNSDFQYALNKDVADKYSTSKDSYLQFSVTPKKV